MIQYPYQQVIYQAEPGAVEVLVSIRDKLYSADFMPRQWFDPLYKAYYYKRYGARRNEHGLNYHLPRLRLGYNLHQV